MKHNAPIAYLRESQFYIVENVLLRKGQIARVIPGSEVPALAPPIAYLAKYIGIVVASERRLRGIGRRIGFCVVDCEELLAFCFINNDNGFIVISRGFLALAVGTSACLLSTEPFVRRSHLNIPILLTEENYKTYPRDENGYPIIENFEENTLFPMLFLAALSAAAIVLHEIAHFVNGHLSLRERQPEVFKSSIIRQAIEYDADCYAVTGLENFMLHMKRRGITVIDHPVARIELISIAAAIAFCSMGRQMVCPDDGWRQSESSHPPEPRRLASMIGIGGELLHRRGLPFDESFKRAGENTVMTVNAARLAFNHEKIDREAEIKELDARHEYLGDLIEGWAQVRPLLEPLKIGLGKLAPVQKRMTVEEAAFEANLRGKNDIKR